MKKHDHRYKIAHKEAWIGVVLVIIHFAIWYGFAYGLGSKPVEKYTYIFGFPAWFFYSCIVGTMIMFILVIISVKVYFKDVSFDEEGEK